MKKQLLALSMVATSGLFAQPDDSTRQTYNQSNCCNLCCCNPCCCTNPRPCVDCECYVPQFYNLQCDWGFSFDAEFLYWYARETNLSYAARVPMVQNVQTPASLTETLLVTGVADLRHLDTSWDPGFRIGVGFNSSCDGWDYNLTWTWYQNKQNNTTSVDDFLIPTDVTQVATLGDLGQSVLLNPWVNRAFIPIGATAIQHGTPTFDRVHAHYRLRFNQVDLDLGRKYWLSECFNLRPFIGLRGAWTRVRFSTFSSRNSEAVDAGAGTTDIKDLSYTDRFRTRAWGVGFIGGLEPTWYFSRCFALFGQMGTGLLWGDFEVRKSENYTTVDTTVATAGTTTATFTYSDSGSHRHAQMTGVLDLGLGLRWERTWCCDRYRTALDLGWEHHILFDQNHRYQSQGRFETTAFATGLDVVGDAYTGYNEATGNLGLGGFVLRLTFDF